MNCRNMKYDADAGAFRSSVAECWGNRSGVVCTMGLFCRLPAVHQK